MFYRPPSTVNVTASESFAYNCLLVGLIQPLTTHCQNIEGVPKEYYILDPYEITIIHLMFNLCCSQQNMDYFVLNLNK